MRHLTVLLSACATTKPIEETAEETAETKTGELTKYEPLVYGAEKPLICTTPFEAEGALKDRPNLQVMWENYPKGYGARLAARSRSMVTCHSTKAAGPMPARCGSLIC